jgi:hypothetical protein
MTGTSVNMLHFEINIRSQGAEKKKLTQILEMAELASNYLFNAVTSLNVTVYSWN